jgi:hypothetical protein
MSYLNGDRTDVVVIGVGGGPAGLSRRPPIWLAGRRQVTVFEKGASQAVAPAPASAMVTSSTSAHTPSLPVVPAPACCASLASPLAGAHPANQRIHLERGSRFYGLPGDVPTLLKTRLLSIREKGRPGCL